MSCSSETHESILSYPLTWSFSAVPGQAPDPGQTQHLHLEKAEQPGTWKYPAVFGLPPDFVSLNFFKLQSIIISESIADKFWYPKSQ